MRQGYKGFDFGSWKEAEALDKDVQALQATLKEQGLTGDDLIFAIGSKDKRVIGYDKRLIDSLYNSLTYSN